MGSKVPNIEDAEIIEVGRFYMVPTVIVKNRPKALSIVPIIGPLHEDAEFVKFPDRHWHPDHRFVTQAWIDDARGWEWATVLTPHPTRPFPPQSDEPRVIDGGRRRLRCRRLLTSFCNPRTETPPVWLKEMEQAYKDERLRDGHICPHRGISCRGVIAESDGVVCPGHGLKWNVETGRLVSRTGQNFSQLNLLK